MPVEVPQVDDWLKQRGFGGRLGFGAEPALLVIDMMNGFTDPDLPLGSDQGPQIGVIARLLAAARAGALPVFLIVSSYAEPDCADAGVWRFKQRGIHTLVAGSHAVQLDERLACEPGDSFVHKRYASAFFGTDLASRLVARGIDTVVLTGCSTSGCVRASAVDAVSHGFRPIVVADAVSDRSASAHRQSLLDLDAKYADVVAADEVLDHWTRAAGSASPPWPARHEPS